MFLILDGLFYAIKFENVQQTSFLNPDLGCYKSFNNCCNKFGV